MNSHVTHTLSSLSKAAVTGRIRRRQLFEFAQITHTDFAMRHYYYLVARGAADGAGDYPAYAVPEKMLETSIYML